MSQEQTFGFLRTCMDKRFVAATRVAFERASGLSETGYWHESYAGGSAVPPVSGIGEEYAAAHGARVFGWQAHINNCGGQPGASDEEIASHLDSVIATKLKQYPNARHFRILASEQGIDIREVTP
ncbi:hypothetical protein [Ktedonospora formicarum]|uniref:Uncharacterized protein n=1 Tax=Ktedonospora formicarum TaxID=2778364 RepID=A0A8J3I0K4_9CHLR|nr:hypothetical protein [Ktedonospora formicarum]GHO46596.1 hypothetical protein KSX_47590 [Ktedonospora formicarum]